MNPLAYLEIAKLMASIASSQNLNPDTKSKAEDILHSVLLVLEKDFTDATSQIIH
jgi:hypothetical protein